jgi:hypothetical protein
MKKIDREQFISGDYKQELMDRKNDMRKWFLSDANPFLLYIKNGEVWCKSEKKVHFDLERKRWIDVIDFNKNFDSLRAAYKWLRRFKVDGYIGYELENKFITLRNGRFFWEVAWDHIQAIKTELIVTKRVTIERLIEIKNDLALFFLSIQDLDDLLISDIVSKALPNGFKFTWENILRRFDLPLTHLHLFESDEIRSEK